MNLVSEPMLKVDMDYVNEAKKYAEEVLAPDAEQWEEDRRQPECLRDMINKFSKHYIPSDLGGTGASVTTICAALEEFAKVDYGTAFAFEVHNHAAIVCSMTENTELRDRYMPKLISGEMIGAFLLTEPGAGSDAASIKCTATEDGDHYVLNGDKAWVTNAGTADFLTVFARTGDKAEDIMTFFVERDTPGVKFNGAYKMVGAHAAETGTFTLENCRVPKENVAFGKGQGLKTALGAIDFARFAIAAMCNGAFIGGLETAIDYTKEREQFGKPLLNNQGMQWKLAEQLTNLEASRLLTYKTAQLLDEGRPASLAAAHCKKYAVQKAFDGVNVCMQSLGANGLDRKYPLARQMTALAITFNTDGTNDICNLVIGRTL